MRLDIKKSIAEPNFDDKYIRAEKLGVVSNK